MRGHELNSESSVMGISAHDHTTVAPVTVTPSPAKSVSQVGGGNRRRRSRAYKRRSKKHHSKRHRTSKHQSKKRQSKKRRSSRRH